MAWNVYGNEHRTMAAEAIGLKLLNNMILNFISVWQELQNLYF